MGPEVKEKFHQRIPYRGEPESDTRTSIHEHDDSERSSRREESLDAVFFPEFENGEILWAQIGDRLSTGIKDGDIDADQGFTIRPFLRPSRPDG
jgi:hypothetical protein